MTTGTDTPLTDYLRQVARTQEEHGHGAISVPGFVLRQGRAFGSQPLTPREHHHLDRCDWRSHPARQCYRNAQLAALTLPPEDGMTLRYAEGFLLRTGWALGIPHAWLSLNGKVVDTTIRVDGEEDRRPLGLIPPGWEYFGVELDPRECLHSLQRHRRPGPLLDDWQCHWPLLARQEDPTRPQNPATGNTRTGRGPQPAPRRRHHPTAQPASHPDPAPPGEDRRDPQATGDHVHTQGFNQAPRTGRLKVQDTSP